MIASMPMPEKGRIRINDPTLDRKRVLRGKDHLHRNSCPARATLDIDARAVRLCGCTLLLSLQLRGDRDIDRTGREKHTPRTVHIGSWWLLWTDKNASQGNEVITVMEAPARMGDREHCTPKLGRQSRSQFLASIVADVTGLDVSHSR